ncbi:unknown [Candidatus Apopatosoma intestinale]|nr:unknown [Candidatus Apopatosoma intestinale]
MKITPSACISPAYILENDATAKHAIAVIKSASTAVSAFEFFGGVYLYIFYLSIIFIFSCDNSTVFIII